ncbi:tetratricopeptide repeat protein, partial [archaeon]|nr:tetratricopeptide repeat protein [archaeon]
MTLVLAVLCPLIFTDVFADSFTVNIDRQLFDVGDSLFVSGKIVNLGMPVIAMSIYDPDGKIVSANNLEISSEKTFSKTIVLESPVYEKIGEYQIKLEYGKVSENYSFILENNSGDSSTHFESFEDHMTLLLNTEKKHYSDNDIVKINGTVSVLTTPSVLIGIYDPIGMPVGFYFGVIDSNLEFSTDFLVKDGVNFRVDGTYSVKAHYEEIETISFFEYSKDPKFVAEDVVAEDVVAEDVVAEDVVAEDVVAEDVV